MMIYWRALLRPMLPRKRQDEALTVFESAALVLYGVLYMLPYTLSVVVAGHLVAGVLWLLWQ